MPDVPACGHVQPSGFNVSNGVIAATFVGNQGGPCQKCGSATYLIANDTTIDVVNDQVIVRRGSLSPEDLRDIASSLSSLQGNNRSKKAIQAAIVQALPALEPEVRGMNLGELLGLIGIILTVLTLWQARNIADEATHQNQAIADGATRQMDELIDQIRKFREESRGSVPGSVHHHLPTSEKQHDSTSDENPTKHP